GPPPEYCRASVVQFPTPDNAMTASHRFFFFCLLGLVTVAPTAANAAAQLEQEADAPRYSRHVAAVFSRLGCNGGACHGAVKGQNGFRLALFGADPALDHERLVREFGGRRLDLHAPEASLLLLKATGQVSHGGGKRMEVGGS